MPCSPSPTCPNTNSYTTANFNAGAGSGAYDECLAHMGWVGFVRLTFDGNSSIGSWSQLLRATGADINLSQEITMPDVIDGRIDKTVYQMSPKIVEGTLNLPLIADQVNTPVAGGSGCTGADFATIAGELVNAVWDWATVRDRYGRMCNPGFVQIRYANHAAFDFDNCLINTMTLNIPNSDAISVDLNVIGRSRTETEVGQDVLTSPANLYNLSPARVLTWNDATITGLRGCQADPTLLFKSNMVREFSLEVNNNVDRFYTLNGSLFPLDINAGKREVTGSFTLLGMNHTLRQLAETNQNRFTEKNEIRLTMYVGQDTQTVGQPRDWVDNNPPGAFGSPIFQKRLASVIFQIEEVSLTNGVLETTVNYLSLASDKDAANYEFVIPASSCGFPNWGSTT